MRLIDHEGFLVDFLHQIRQLDGFQPDGCFTAVSACQKEKLFHKVVHMLCFILYGADGFIQDLFIVLPPAAEHVGIPLNHGDRRAQFMGGVVDKTCLLAVGIPHPDQEVVDGGLDADKVGILEGKRLCLSGADMFDRLLQNLVFVLREGQAAEFIRAHRDLIDGIQGFPDSPVFPVIGEEETDQLEGQDDADDGADNNQDLGNVLLNQDLTAAVFYGIPQMPLHLVDGQGT